MLLCHKRRLLLCATGFFQRAMAAVGSDERVLGLLTDDPNANKAARKMATARGTPYYHVLQQRCVHVCGCVQSALSKSTCATPHMLPCTWRDTLLLLLFCLLRCCYSCCCCQQ